MSGPENNKTLTQISLYVAPLQIRSHRITKLHSSMCSATPREIIPSFSFLSLIVVF